MRGERAEGQTGGLTAAGRYHRSGLPVGRRFRRNGRLLCTNIYAPPTCYAPFLLHYTPHMIEESLTLFRREDLVHLLRGRGKMWIRRLVHEGFQRAFYLL